MGCGLAMLEPVSWQITKLTISCFPATFPAKPVVFFAGLISHYVACYEYYNLVYSYVKNRLELNEKWSDEVGNLVLSKPCNFG